MARASEGHGRERVIDSRAMPSRQLATSRIAFASSNIASVVRASAQPSSSCASQPRSVCRYTLPSRPAKHSSSVRATVRARAGGALSHRHRAPRARDFSDFGAFRAAEVFHAIAIPNLKERPGRGGTIAPVGVTATSRA